MKSPCIVIGGGLSGLAAAIRLARFLPDVVLLERHSRLGGLNSYYYRHKRLFETGLHAITNYAAPQEKRAPLNRLFRQLKLSRNSFSFLEQQQSEIVFRDCASLLFSNDPNLLKQEINEKFPLALPQFEKLLCWIETFDPFIPVPFRSAKAFLREILGDELLIDMLLCPLMYYGSAVEEDMDLSQFAIMFRAIFIEGMFRPEGTIREFIKTLENHFISLGGTIRRGTEVKKLRHENKKITAITLHSGEELTAEYLISTIGLAETQFLLRSEQSNTEATATKRLGFIESIFQIPSRESTTLPQDRTIIFYNNRKKFTYKDPQKLVDTQSGVICFPAHFNGLNPTDYQEVRTTHLASYQHWEHLASNRKDYLETKNEIRQQSRIAAEKIIGKLPPNIVYEDSFTPLTIERYTAKKMGAIYGSPTKIKDGDIGYENMFLAGTDQGFLGIVGSMLSGISIVNQQVLARL